MTPEQDLYTQAVTLIQSGDLVKAREILSQLLKIDRGNINYWLWMSAAVETTKERVYCLREALLIDPENPEAAQGLRMLGEKAPDLNDHLPVTPLTVPWKTKLELADQHPSGPRGLRSRVAIYSLLGVVIIAIFVFGIFLALQPSRNNNNAPIKRWTITPIPTATETLTPNPTGTGPTPFSIALEATFTPTPIYVATPHNRLEAYASGMRAYEEGNWVNAADYFKQVLASEPNDADVYYHLGDVYRFQGLYANALSAYQSAIKIDPNFAPGYLGEAQVYLYGPTVKTDVALSDLQKAVSLDPGLNQAYLELANISLAQNDPESALSWLGKLDTAMPNNAVVELDRAKAYLAEGDFDHALTAIENANQYDRSLLEVYQVWAEILQANGNYADSINPLLIVLANQPSSPDSEILLARAYFEDGNTDKALSMVNESLQQNDKLINAYLLRADIYLQQGQVDEARADFNSVLHLDFYNFDANLGIGRVYLAQNFPGGAYNAFDYTEKFAKTNTQNATLLYWRAISLLDLNNTTAAIRDFEAALAFTGNTLPQKLRLDAEKQLNTLYTPTPSFTPTMTQMASQTPTVGSTPTPSFTPSQK